MTRAPDQMIVKLGNRTIGPGHPTMVVAEIGANHDGRLETAIRLVDEAAKAGADAVKLQSFLADEMVLPDHPSYPELKRLEIPREWYGRLAAAAREADILLFSTATNTASIGWMEELGFPCYKIASAHVTYYPLLADAARLGKPIILSTGYSTLSEIARAVETIVDTGNRQIVVLHCVSEYPARPERIHLRTMLTLGRAFGYPVGYSDHVLGPTVALAAVALGACIVEKHVTLDRSAPGADHAISLEPAELAQFVRAVREVEAALGDAIKVLGADEARDRALVRRTMHAARAVRQGTVIARDMIRFVRPSDGLAPEFLSVVLGRSARRDLPAGAAITWDDV